MKRLLWVWEEMVVPVVWLGAVLGALVVAQQVGRETHPLVAVPVAVFLVGGIQILFGQA